MVGRLDKGSLKRLDDHALAMLAFAPHVMAIMAYRYASLAVERDEGLGAGRYRDEAREVRRLKTAYLHGLANDFGEHEENLLLATDRLMDDDGGMRDILMRTRLTVENGIFRNGLDFPGMRADAVMSRILISVWRHETGRMAAMIRERCHANVNGAMDMGLDRLDGLMATFSGGVALDPGTVTLCERAIINTLGGMLFNISWADGEGRGDMKK